MAFQIRFQMFNYSENSIIVIEDYFVTAFNGFHQSLPNNEYNKIIA